MKKIVLIALIFFLVAIGIASYFIFWKSPLAPVQTGVDENGNPFGSLAPNATRNPSQSNNPITNAGTTGPVNNLSRIYGDPASGAVAFASANGTVVRLTDRATGHIYDFPLNTGVLQKISNTTIPKIYESVWLPTGSTTILRYVNESTSAIQTYSAKLVAPKTASTTSITVQGTFFPENIESFAINPAGTKVFYVTRGSAGSQGTTANPDATGKTAIFSSAISEWNAQWPNAAVIALTTKPSSAVRGFLYFMDTSGILRKILGNINGLTTNTNSQGTLVAYTDSIGSLQLLDVKTGQSSPLSHRTIADKCTWSKKQATVIYCAVPTEFTAGNFPDSWYQGTASFSDEIYRIDTGSNTSTKVGALKSGFNQDIDVTSLSLNAAEDYLTFINKKDLSLWGLRLATGTSTPR